MHERTFLAVKPDGVQRRLVGEIVRRFERKGFKLVALKLVLVRAGVPRRGERDGGVGERSLGVGSAAGWGAGGDGVPARGGWGSQEHASLPPLPPQASEELLRQHYAELRERPFYGRLVKYMGSGPVVAMVSAGWREGGALTPC